MKKILMTAALAFLAFGCGRTEEVKTNAPAPAPAANAPANTAPIPPIKEETYTSGADPRADLISAAQKRLKLPFWSAKVTVENMPQANSEMKYVAPDRYQFKLPTGEMIVVGSESYSNKEGKWEKADEGAGEFIKEKVTRGIAEGAMSLKDVQITGKEQVNGKDATVYTYTADGTTTKVWLATDSGLELKNEVTFPIQSGITVKRTTVYDYDTPVKIEAPKVN